MKKIYLFAGIVILALGLTYCSSKSRCCSKTTYTANVSTVIAGSCSPAIFHQGKQKTLR
jgi:hypothetical protein